MSDKAQIKAIITKYLPRNDFKVFLFGSRASGKNRPGSDFDIGIMGKKPVDFGIMGLLEEDLENSDIPYKIDIVDFQRVPEGFKKLALRKTISL